MCSDTGIIGTDALGLRPLKVLRQIRSREMEVRRAAVPVRRLLLLYFIADGLNETCNQMSCDALAE